MSSVVLVFRHAMRAAIPEDFREHLDRGFTNRPSSVFEDGYRLTRHGADWAGETIGRLDPGRPNGLAPPCPEVTSPRYGARLAGTGLIQRRREHDNQQLQALCGRVILLGECLELCDERDVESSMVHLHALAECAAELLADAATIGESRWEWACQKANRAMVAGS